MLPHSRGSVACAGTSTVLSVEVDTGKEAEGAPVDGGAFAAALQRRIDRELLPRATAAGLPPSSAQARLLTQHAQLARAPRPHRVRARRC